MTTTASTSKTEVAQATLESIDETPCITAAETPSAAAVETTSSLTPNIKKMITEGSASMILQSEEDETAVFYNPVQVQNRDLSVLMITLYNERRAVRHAVHQYTYRLKKESAHNKPNETDQITTNEIKEKVAEYSSNLSGRMLLADYKETMEKGGDENPPDPTRLGGLSILDALAASGLRSIRYWKEIPGVHHVCINDLEAAAVHRARRNIEHNSLQHALTRLKLSADAVRSPRSYGISVQQEDAKDVMYNSRCRPYKSLQQLQNQQSTPMFLSLPPWDVIDLDPYGSSAPFLDAAVQAVANNGLLCLTCTDMAALGGAHPETGFGRYAAMTIPRVGYLHELALRVFLYTVATVAARYGRTIQPVLSVGMDFYIRCFVQIQDNKAAVADLSLHTGLVFQSTVCPSFTVVPAGKKGGTKNNVYQASRAPYNDDQSEVKIAGPIWIGPLHDTDVVSTAIRRLEEKNDSLPPAPDLRYLATKDRLRGLLKTCQSELNDAPLFYKTSELAQTLRCSTPSLSMLQAALLRAGYRVSGFHKEPHALKTNAPNSVIWDIMRLWCQKHPPAEMSSTSAHHAVAKKILEQEITTPNLSIETRDLRSFFPKKENDVARFPGNPQPNWGPKSKATGRFQNNNNKKYMKRRRTDVLDAADEAVDKMFPPL